MNFIPALLFLFYAGSAFCLTCNGFEELCDRRVDEVTFASAHNAMASIQEGFVPPDQDFSLEHQVQSGIRAFKLVPVPYKHTAYLCHGFCELGKVSLFSWMVRLRTQLETRPHEVMIIIFQNLISSKDMVSVLHQAGILPYLHEQNPDAEWPTLRTLIQNNTRLILFADTATEALPWLHNSSDFVRATEWNVARMDQYTCDLNETPKNNSIYRLYNLILDPFALRPKSAVANSNPFLIRRALGCMNTWKHKPNIVEVQFYSAGNLFDAVQYLNLNASVQSN